MITSSRLEECCVNSGRIFKKKKGRTVVWKLPWSLNAPIPSLAQWFKVGVKGTVMKERNRSISSLNFGSFLAF